MKKLLITILGLSLFCFSANAFERKIGFSASMAMLDTTVTDDIDSNGSIDTTKDITNDVIIPSFFLEFATDLPNGSKASFGVDYIPMSAELESDQQLNHQMEHLALTVVLLMRAIILLHTQLLEVM